MNKKKLMGLLFPVIIFLFMICVYYALIVNPYYLNRERMFGTPGIKAVSIIYLIVFHVLLISTIYCYVACMVKNPGQPPKFWVSLSGVLRGLAGREAQALLRDLQQLQARALPPLLDLRPVRAGHGPPLSLAQ